jgi:hypothetical protein
MNASHEIPELDRKGLRQFGLVTGGIIAGLFGLAFPWLFDRQWPLWPWIVFGVLALMALAAPMALKSIYKHWMKFGLLLSKVTTPIIFGLVFFVVMLPMGMLRRTIGGDVLGRKLDRSVSSYRIPSNPSPKQKLEKPY